MQEHRRKLPHAAQSSTFTWSFLLRDPAKWVKDVVA
jgi:hypothetical protein